MSNYYNLLESMQNMGIFLCEGIDDMKKYYPNISGDDFIKYIELDPTYKKGSDKAGQYAKWILGLANKNGGKLDRENHINDILTRFDRDKKQLKDKDIMKFKSVEDLDNYLNDDNNYTELSHRQEVRQRQKDRHNVDLDNEAYLIYEDSDWEVWVPKTYAASCKLGQGTSWCTASTESSYYFNSYTRNGDLYININKHNPKEKYQFHFESNSYMDKDDKEINIDEFFANNPSLYDKVYIYWGKFGGIDKDEMQQQLSKLRKNNYTYYYDGFKISDCVKKNIKKLIVSNIVTSIGNLAFSNCTSLTSIVIPDSVKSIGDYAFYGCPIEMAIITTDAIDYISNKSLKTVILTGGTSIGSEAFFYNGSNLTSIVIPNSVTSIGGFAFKGCTSLTSIVIPNSVTSIGKYAFSDCDSLKIYCEVESKPSGWKDDWNPSNCPIVWGYKNNNKTNESLQEVTNAERKGYGEKQNKQYNLGGQRVKTDGMNLSPLDKKDIYIGHHLYGKHEGKYDVVIPRSIHNKINDRVFEEMNKCAKNKIKPGVDFRNDEDLYINSLLNSLSRDIKSLEKRGLHVDLNIDALRKQACTQYIQDVLDDKDLRQQLYVKIFIDEFYNKLQSDNKIYVSDCGQDKINKYNKNNNN